MKSEYVAEDYGYDSAETIAVLLTGIVDDPRCITDLTELADRIYEKIKSIQADENTTSRFKHIVIGGDHATAVRLDKITPDNITCSAYKADYKQFLDDDGSNPADNYTVYPVRKTAQTVKSTLQELNRLSEDSSFDLSDAEDRAKVDRCVVKHLPADRYRRAKKKSEATRLHRLTDDWYDSLPTADHVLHVSDHKSDTSFLLQQMWEGKSGHIKYPNEVDGYKSCLIIEDDEQSPIDWDLANLFVPDYYDRTDYASLSPVQQRHVDQWATSGERRLHELPDITEQDNTIPTS